MGQADKSTPLNGGSCEGAWCEQGAVLEALKVDKAAESALLRTVADRVGSMRPDGTSTPHSLTHAVQALGDQVLALKRVIEDGRGDSTPVRLFDALDDEPMSDITKADIRAPVRTSRRLRGALKQRNWLAIIAGGSAAIVAIIEALAKLGVFK